MLALYPCGRFQVGSDGLEGVPRGEELELEVGGRGWGLGRLGFTGIERGVLL